VLDPADVECGENREVYSTTEVLHIEKKARGMGSAVKFPAGFGAEPRPQVHFGRIKSPENASRVCKCRLIPAIDTGATAKDIVL